MNDEVLNMSQVISNAFKNIRCEDVENANKLFDVWKEILFSIQGSGSFNNPGNRFEGQNLYDHSRILDLKNGMLLIEADHPGWIQLLQMHKKYILTGLKKKAPDLKINNMVFKLKGAGGELADVEGSSYSVEKTKQDIQKQIEKEEEELQKINEKLDNTEKSSNSGQKKELPPELAAIFADLEQSMLTNSEN